MEEKFINLNNYYYVKLSKKRFKKMEKSFLSI